MHPSGEHSPINSFNNSSDTLPHLPSHLSPACERICVTLNLTNKYKILIVSRLIKSLVIFFQNNRYLILIHDTIFLHMISLCIMYRYKRFTLSSCTYINLYIICNIIITNYFKFIILFIVIMFFP